MDEVVRAYVHAKLEWRRVTDYTESMDVCKACALAKECAELWGRMDSVQRGRALVLLG